MVTWQAPRADKVSKIVEKYSKSTLITLTKNYIDCISRFFSDFFYD